jgi:putative NADH-flavin reductase
MKLIILGATGKTGQHTWRKALEKGHEVTLFVRSVEKIDSVDSKLNIVQGDLFDADAVANAVAKHEAAIVCLGSTGLRDKTTLTVGTKNVSDGMSRHNVGRLVIISAAGVGESWTQISWFSRLLFRTLLRNIFSDHTAQEAIVKEGSLDWTIVRSAVLTDQPASGDYIASNTSASGRISRADLADFLVKQVSDKTYMKQAGLGPKSCTMNLGLNVNLRNLFSSPTFPSAA